jgi:hypothetical protein
MCKNADGTYTPASDYLSDAKRRDEHLLTLKSVSRAYRRSAVRELKLKAKEKNDVSRQSAQEAARGAGNALGGGYGGPQYSNSIGYLAQRSHPYINVYNTPGIYAQQLQAGVANSIRGIGYGYGGGGGGGITAFIPGVGYVVSAGGITGHADELTDTSLPVEFKAGELTAWRVWIKKDGIMRSATQMTEWKMGDVIAGDVAKANEGVHAFNTEARARDYAAEWMRAYVQHGASGYEIVLGTVDLWGDVIVHEKGYRASFASIKEIVEVMPVPCHGQYAAGQYQVVSRSTTTLTNGASAADLERESFSNLSFAMIIVIAIGVVTRLLGWL